MKLKAIVLTGLLFASLLVACGNGDDPLPENCIQARWIDDFCGNAVIQVLSPAHYGLAQDHWTDGQGEEFEHVFGTFLDCDDMQSIPRDGSTFLIKITEENANQECGVCLGLLTPMPETFRYMKIIESCEEEAQD